MSFERTGIFEIINGCVYVAGAGDGYYVSGIEQAADRIERLMRWRPIASAPLDGTEIDLFSVSGHRWCGFRYDKEVPYPAWTEARYANSSWMDRPLIMPESVAYWMPIPRLPSNEGARPITSHSDTTINQGD